MSLSKRHWTQTSYSHLPVSVCQRSIIYLSVFLCREEMAVSISETSTEFQTQCFCCCFRTVGLTDLSWYAWHPWYLCRRLHKLMRKGLVYDRKTQCTVSLIMLCSPPVGPVMTRTAVKSLFVLSPVKGWLQCRWKPFGISSLTLCQTMQIGIAGTPVQTQTLVCESLKLISLKWNDYHCPVAYASERLWVCDVLIWIQSLATVPCGCTLASACSTHSVLSFWYPTDDGKQQSKIKVEIKPFSPNGAAPTGNVDDIRKSIEGLRLSPTSGVSTKLIPLWSDVFPFALKLGLLGECAHLLDIPVVVCAATTDANAHRCQYEEVCLRIWYHSQHAQVSNTVGCFLPFRI